MSTIVDVRESDTMQRWHRAGLVSFMIGIAVMLVAVLVTRTFTSGTAAVLAGSLVITGVARIAFCRSSLAHRRISLMLAPISTIATISVLGHYAPAASGLVVGLFVLSFLFIGLSQKPCTSLWIVLPAPVGYLQALDLPSSQAAVRLPIAALVWIIVAVIPARLISELRDKQQALELLATTDPMTGLLNRSVLDPRLASADRSSSVVLIDLDHFKEFNDEHGHVAGDGALTDFAAMLQANSRGQDAVFRYGGEEFLLVLDRIALPDAVDVVERIASSWSTDASGLTFSAGITLGGPDAVRTADALLYRAKNAGRNQIVAEAPAPDAAAIPPAR